MVSSHPHVMQVTEPKQRYGANEQKQVNLIFPAQPRPGSENVYLHVNEENSRARESYLLKVTVQNQ